jgi:tetratricopeptide (TPR) repeat protein
MKRIFKTIAFASLLFLASCGNNPEKSRNFYDKGMDYLYCSQFEEAIENFDKAIKYNDQNHEAYFYRGCAKYNIFQRESAIEDYNKTLELNPNYLQAYFNLGLYTEA